MFFYHIETHVQWNFVIKRSDTTKHAYNKVILLVQALYVSFVCLLFTLIKWETGYNKVIFMVPRSLL